MVQMTVIVIKYCISVLHPLLLIRIFYHDIFDIFENIVIFSNPACGPCVLRESNNCTVRPVRLDSNYPPLPSPLLPPPGYNQRTSTVLGCLCVGPSADVGYFTLDISIGK